MQVWGLTGGIASGKSQVAACLRRRGAHVLDADAVYHGLLQPTGGGPSPLARAVAEAFPALPLLRVDGSLDRAPLGALVFADAGARRALEAIAHPAVAAAAAAGLAELAAAGVAHAIYEVPLLFEKNMQGRFAGVVLVWVSAATQRQRLMARDRLDAAAAEARLRSQLPLDDKRLAATWTVDNDGSRDRTEAQVDAVWAALQRR